MKMKKVAQSLTPCKAQQPLPYKIMIIFAETEAQLPTPSHVLSPLATREHSNTALPKRELP